ncbi:toxin-antitoxin system, toxin component, PIN family [delta proteobacterium NaphS2]|nr:toxin-antitoxin system, toxin component, PIN family [delta proteobacterium NaphS2]
MDTCAYSQFKRGNQTASDLVSKARWVGMPVIVLGELRTGFRSGKYFDRNELELQAFLNNPVVHILDVDEIASSHYSETVAELRLAGTPIPTNDIWVAAIAIREGAVVVTYDGHFKLIHRVATHLLSI